MVVLVLLLVYWWVSTVDTKKILADTIGSDEAQALLDGVSATSAVIKESAGQVKALVPGVLDTSRELLAIIGGIQDQTAAANQILDALKSQLPQFEPVLASSKAFVSTMLGEAEQIGNQISSTASAAASMISNQKFGDIATSAIANAEQLATQSADLASSVVAGVKKVGDDIFAATNQAMTIVQDGMPAIQGIIDSGTAMAEESMQVLRSAADNVRDIGSRATTMASKALSSVQDMQPQLQQMAQGIVGTAQNALSTAQKASQMANNLSDAATDMANRVGPNVMGLAQQTQSTLTGLISSLQSSSGGISAILQQVMAIAAQCQSIAMTIAQTVAQSSAVAIGTAGVKVIFTGLSKIKSVLEPLQAMLKYIVEALIQALARVTDLVNQLNPVSWITSIF